MTLAGGDRAQSEEPTQTATRKYVYRREATPGGLEKMRRGDLEHFDLEMYANFNTGHLEEYLDAKNRRDAFVRSRWNWGQIALGLAVGTAFALINMYVGLKIGLIVYGAWYVAYLLGVGLKWGPTEINLSAGAANGTAFMVTGFVYVFPALFLLSDYNVNLASPIITAAALPSLGIAIVSAALAGILGTLYFVIFRRIWLVEDPLPYPQFESYIKLLDMTNDAAGAMADRARRSISLVFAFGGLAALFTFLRDFPLFRTVRPGGAVENLPALSKAAQGSSWYAAGEIVSPTSAAHYSWFSFALSPILFATGWFMRMRAALVVTAGSLFVWFVAIPMAVYFNVPVFLAGLGGKVGLETLWQDGRPSAILAFGGVMRTMAAGAILGGGLTALVKMAPAFRSTIRDLFRVGGEGRGAYEPGRGWYEWPPQHIVLMLGVTLLALPALFWLGGYPIGASILFSLLFVLTSFFLGAIACKVLGETSIEPVSGTSFIVFLLSFALFQSLDMPLDITIAMGLLGTSVYATAIAMTGDILLDYKNALYVGTRPYHQTKAVLVGVIPGAIAGVLAATLLSIGLAQGKIVAAAPQANAFATLVQAVVGGHIDISIFALGLAIGILVEVLTGMGTAFGLGMFFTLGIALPLLAGGILRDLWEKKILEPRARKGRWSEEKKTVKLLDTYMIATGLIVGEAIVGTIVALYLTAGLIAG